jgi:hypothetical protein
MGITRNLANFAPGPNTSGVVPSGFGGTGQATLTANSVILGNSTGSVQTVSPGASGNVLTSNGTIWISQEGGGGGGGATGLTGATGLQGDIGATGASGIQGATGASGIQGATGASGIQGATGASGIQGEIGATGIGTPGATGVAGLTGATGAGGSLTITNDTATATNIFPALVTATTGNASGITTSNAKLLYKPSTGELQASAMVSTNGITINEDTVSASYTVAAGTNGLSVGPMTVEDGVTVTVASGQRWLVL